MRRSLFLKYVVLFVGLVTGVLVINAALDLYFVYQDNRRASIEVQTEKAQAAAQRVESFVREIERQIGWVAHPQWARLPEEQRRFDYVRLQRQVPAIAELAYIDRDGREQLKVSRLSMDVMGSGLDRSKDPAFVQATANKVYFGPVYFHKESEPHMVMAVSHGRRGGVTVATVNLKLILEVIEAIRIGREGYAYAVNKEGRLVAHPDISLVLRGTDMSRLPHVAAALKAGADGDAPTDAKNRNGVSVLSAHAVVPAVDWLVFVELPVAEAEKPVVDAGLRALALLLFGLLIAGAAGALLARRMVVPIRALQAGAARMGGGELGHRLDIKTGDEIEALANQFNRSAAALEESYATLEQRVEDRTRELSESLEQQTATSEILRVISQSPTDVQPVLDVIARNAVKLCEGERCAVFRYDGSLVYFAAADSATSEDLGGMRTRYPRPPEPRSMLGAAILGGTVVDTVNRIEDARFQLSPIVNYKAALAVPMLRDGQAIGVIYVTREIAQAFTRKQIDLVKIFAAQAVIAIQNVRLFSELRESLEQQTATSEILQVISQSPTDVKPVLDAVAAAARRFCGARDVTIIMRDGADVVAAAHDGDGSLKMNMGSRDSLDRTTGMGLSILEARTVHIPDLLAPEAEQFVRGRALSKEAGHRAVVAAPMLRENEAIGCFLLRKPEPGPFTVRQIELAESFAAQAVIAIQNVQLFTELRDTLEQQTATAEILEVISQSPTDVAPVLTAVVKAAVRFCGAQDAVITLRDGNQWFFAAHEGRLSPELGQRHPLTRETAPSRAIVDAQTVHFPDIEALDRAEFAAAHRLSAEQGFRAAVAAPMLLEDVAIGAVALRKPVAGPFTPRQIELLETFAAQAVIAIQNVRLFTEIQEKSRQLEVASQHKSQFLANMSHELRTPLNAIIGYTEMMADGLYGDVPEKAQGVLERVQSNGRHLLGLINDVLDLSKIEAGQLVLAIEEYSVTDMVATVMSATESLARTKSISLAASVSPGLPTGHGDARRLAQVLLNLVGNAIKFTDQGGVEIRAERAGDRFEISVADTGPGIAPADQGKIFEEFQQVDNSSTRKKGGTGLGLSISRKIVELHGGRIAIRSQLGEGSTFTVSIPIDARSIKDALKDAAQ